MRQSKSSAIRLRRSLLVVVVLGGFAGCGDPASSSSTAAVPVVESPVPTVPPAPPPIGGVPPPSTLVPPTLAPDFVDTGERALRASPTVATAIGAAFDIVTVEPVGSYEQPSGIAFLVHTREPVTMPAGTATTKSTGEGEPTVIGPSATPMGPLSYIYVIFNAELSDPVFLPVPDVLAEHETLPN